MTRAEIYKPLLDKLSQSDYAEEHQCQISLVTGINTAGVILKTETNGLYVMRTLMRRGDQRTGSPDMVDLYFSAEDVASIMVPVSRKEQSGLVTPAGEPIIPKPRMS